MRGAEALQTSTPELTKCLTDPSPYVRIHAAWALALSSDPTTAAAALKLLGEHVPMDRNASFVSFAALTAIDHLGLKALGLKDAAAAWPVDGPFPHSRYTGYTPALKHSILARFGLPTEPSRQTPSGRKATATQK